MISLHLMSPALAALLQVILIDIVLAGDNAVVIGISASHVPKLERPRVIFWGLAAAVILRVLLAVIIVNILKRHIALMLAGGILLLWVAWRIYRDARGSHEDSLGAQAIADIGIGDISARLPTSSPVVRRAIMRIAVADLSMSLDNVLAVAGAAMNAGAMNYIWVLAVGLLLSIALMGFAAAMIANLLQRMPWISYAGLIIVIYVALRMVWVGSMAVLHGA